MQLTIIRNKPKYFLRNWSDKVKDLQSFCNKTKYAFYLVCNQPDLSARQKTHN